MRIVVFSDLCPPLCLGGYEIGAARVVDELRRRGHEVLLLSARGYSLQEGGGFRHARHTGKGPDFLDVGLCVFGSLPRLLWKHPVCFLRGMAGTLQARRRYRREVAAFRPERVLLFNPLAVVAPVMHDLAELARQAGAEVHAYVSDDWPAIWPAPHPLLRPLDRLRRSPRLLSRVTGGALSALLAAWAPTGPPPVDRYVWCSASLRRRCLGAVDRSADGPVVPWGLAGMERLPQPPPGHFRGAAPLTLLFAGQIQEHKGLAVLLRAQAACRRPHRLAVLGDDATPHAGDCRRLAAELGLAGRVRFLGKKSHAETMSLMRVGHVLIVPSLWEEPFGLVVVEGMALGLPVVASDRGGPAEVIRAGDTGFLFPVGQAAALAATLDRLEEDRALCEQVGARARQAALAGYMVEDMVGRLLDEAPAPAAYAAPEAAAAKAG
jgi:glycosyltransferase involved in cell wall biosynthesis